MEPTTALGHSSIRTDEPDPRQSLQHVLSAPDEEVGGLAHEEPAKASSPSRSYAVWIQEPGKEHGEEERSVQSDSYSRAADINPAYSMTVVHSRRNANGTIGSVYSGNKIRHLKKEDGIPLWRKDIQFAFLCEVFRDKAAVFTLDMDGSPGHTFADIYISAMARSSKTSKVLRDKLLSDRESAVNMAMICLLVNVGRMNTTLNFFPEMRAQLRTYHSIPCLQTHQDQNAPYKGLQDAPRLKSILKGACEDAEQPNSIEKIQAASIPRTNPVNLIFVLSQYAPKISETHFFQPRDFFDLVIRSTLSSRSRARAFLWLVWWYLESDFSQADSQRNPFGPGLPTDDGVGIAIKVPAFEHLTEDQATAENVDTEEEIRYGEKMRQVRKRILEEDDTTGPPLKKRLGDSFDDRPAQSPARSDLDCTRSPSPITVPPLNMPKPRKHLHGRDENGARSESDRLPTARLVLKSGKSERALESSSPAPSGSGHLVLNAAPTVTPHARRNRPETSHQKAISNNRKMRIDKILHERLMIEQRQAIRRNRESISTLVYQAMSRISDLPSGYDTEDEASWGPGGLLPNHEEIEDFGGEALRRRKVINRTLRRLDRGSKGRLLGDTQGAPQARKRRLVDLGDAENQERYASAKRVRSNMEAEGQASLANGTQEEGIDDLDLDLLGEDRVDDESNDDTGLYDSEDEDDAAEYGIGEEG